MSHLRRVLVKRSHRPCSGRPRRLRGQRTVNPIDISAIDLVFLGFTIFTIVYWLAAGRFLRA